MKVYWMEVDIILNKSSYSFYTLHIYQLIVDCSIR